MKKYFRNILALMLLCALMLSGCGEFVPADGPGDDTGAEQPGDNTPVSPPSSDLKDDPNAFTVAIRLEGRLFRETEGVIAQWSDGFSFYTADFASDGYARIAGLDGDYDVTLKGLPDGFLYNPNMYVATNDDRHIIIDIYSPEIALGDGKSLYKCIGISELGVYRTKIEKDSQIVYYEFRPTKSGTYSVESWMSTAEGNYNPKIDVYTGSIAAKYFAYTLDDGGYSEGYTRNFKHIVEIADEEIGHAFTFAVHCDSRNGVYPANLDFAVQLNGSFSLDHADKELIIPNLPLVDTPDYDPGLYTWKWAETETKGVEGRYQYDGSMFKLWATEDGGDGFYHVYDETLYRGYTDPNGKVYADGYGPILYAKISSPHRFTAEAFTQIEAAGNSALTVNGNLNHKLFIEGFATLIVDPFKDNPNSPNATHGSYFCLRECPCRINKSCPGVCGESCMDCLEGCRNLPDEVIEKMIITDDDYYCEPSCPCYADHMSSEGGEDFCTEGWCWECLDSCYQKPTGEVEGFTWTNDVNDKLILVANELMGLARYSNSDGVYGVTEQVKEFLQGFSITQRYFADGQGWVETHPQYKVDAKEADQWLFACGYYVSK